MGEGRPRYILESDGFTLITTSSSSFDSICFVAIRADGDLNSVSSSPDDSDSESESTSTSWLLSASVETNSGGTSQGAGSLISYAHALLESASWQAPTMIARNWNHTLIAAINNNVLHGCLYSLFFEALRRFRCQLGWTYQRPSTAPCNAAGCRYL